MPGLKLFHVSKGGGGGWVVGVGGGVDLIQIIKGHFNVIEAMPWRL